jgi:MiaB-like tRNA modifying enzyme
LINLERLNEEVHFDGVVGPATGIGIVDVVRRVSAGERVVALGEALSSMPSLLLPRIRLNPVIGMVPVNHGCLGSCAYCCVAFAKGSLRSHSMEEVVGRLKRDLNEGVREFWITSQDTASYGKDKGTNLVGLLKAISAVEGDFKVRVGMMTPSSVMGILDEMVEAFRDGHVFKFVHLPVQSGSDEVLERMRRSYTVNDFRSVVDAFKAKIPDITLSTDIICGFPCESEKAFEETLHLVGEVRPDVVNISKFFPRPRTLAAGMTADFVPLREIKRRSSEATRFSRKIALERNQRWIGWAGDILVDEAGRIPCSWIGRNFAYKPVVVKSPLCLLGKTLHATVVKAFWTHLEADIVE